jgi:transposase-like protein
MRRVYSAEEKAVLVAEYLAVQHGCKEAWRAERGIGHTTMSNWRKAYFFGDLERSLVPRDTSSMSVSDGARLKQLELQLAAEKQARAAELQRHGDELRRHAAEVERLNKVNDALGKAIGLLHDREGGPEPTDGS